MENPHARALTDEERAVVDEEERLCAAVRAAVEEARAAAHGRAERLVALSSLREDFAGAGEEDRPAVLAQLHEESAREAAAAGRLLPDLSEPFFGHLRVRSSGRARDVLVGARPFLDPGRG